MTAVIRLANKRQRWPLFLSLRAWPAIPALCLLRAAWTDSPHIADYAGQVLGFDATLVLVACLLVTPLISVARVKAAALRWWYGVWLFWLALAGLLITLTVGGPGGYMMRMSGDAVNWTGLLLVVLLFPMVATSNKFAQKKLGPEWKRWQRSLVWCVWALVLGHLALLHAWFPAIAFAAATVPSILLRVPRVRRAVKKWRADGYSTGGLWLVLSVCSVVTAAGLVILLTEEVQACAHALALWPVS